MLVQIEFLIFVEVKILLRKTFMNLLKTILAVSAVALIPNVTDAQLPVKAETFPVSDVRVISGPFKHAEDMDIRYLLGLDPDRLLAPYLKGAGLKIGRAHV